MKNKKSVVVIQDKINENVLNIITPSGIDFDNTSANVGENYGKIYCISRYPANVDYGWLAPLCNLEGTATQIEYRYTTSERMQKVMNKRISELKSDEETVKQESDKQKIQQAVKDLQEMIQRIAVKNEPVGYINIMLFPQATGKADLNARIKRISSAVAVQECNIRNLKYRQIQALKAISPYGIPDQEVVSNIGERNMPISTFAGGFPMANAGLNDKRGYYLGKTKNNRIVRLNQWLRNKDRVNSNWFISGVPGAGKSTVLKAILTKEYALRTQIIMFDPEREYVDLANHPYFNGKVINCGGGDDSRINPLQINLVPRITEEDLEPEETMEDYLEYDDKNGTSDMALHIQQLRVFFKMYFGDEAFDYEIKAVLEKCLIELYNSFGITWETDITKLSNTDYPIMQDLGEVVKKKEQEELDTYAKSIYRRLGLLLYSACEGADQQLWNGYTTLEATTDFTDLDVSSLLELDDNVKRAQFYNITSWAWNQMARDRTERVMLGIDEGYLMIDPEYPELMKNIRNISKRDRKYEGGLMFITHACVDVLDESVKRYGQAIIDNACYKFIMGTDGKNLEETQKLFHFSDQEVAILASKNRGQGIFMFGGSRLDLRVDVKTEFLEMFGSGGGR